jgi:hypothetical protein
MRIHGVRIVVLLDGAVTYVRRRIRHDADYFSVLLSDAYGSTALPTADRRMALGIDAMLRRVRVRCLWRSAVVTEILRRRGFAARVRLSVAADRAKAHAECEVGGESLRPHPPNYVLLG